MNWQVVRAIMWKDIHIVRTNRMVWVPMIVVPVFLMVLLPLGLVLAPRLAPADFASGEMMAEDFQTMLAVLPDGIRQRLMEMDPTQQWIYLATTHVFAPMFLILPIMLSSIIASDSFAGERERGTLEPLLYTPVSEGELFAGKVLAALVPAIGLGLAAFALNVVVVNAAGYGPMGGLFFPNTAWFLMVLLLSPACALLGLGVTVLISSKAKTVTGAQQASGALVLPVVLLMVGQLAGAFYFGGKVILLATIIAGGVGLALVWLGARTFKRGELIARI
ncbi:MAG: ABC transporter permease subunit [Anaerolineae bacterium]